MSIEKNFTGEFSYQLDEFYLDLQADGSQISLLPPEQIERMPFPGLRPFKTAEFQLFRGRGGQSEELIKRLSNSHFLAVIGSSGTGKSSLVRAGLIPQLLGGYLHTAGNKWDIAICRPGKDPIENLAIALSSVKSKSKKKPDILNAYKEIKPVLSNSIYGVLQVKELLDANEATAEKTNLLIIIDQFEELFRFDRKDLGRDNIESHFVNLLLKASLLPDSSVYVIITVRSEFLGDCVKYRGLPEAINAAQYLVPQLDRDQIREVIEGPINLAGKKIAPGLVELLINEIEESKLKENLDQLPIMQHALMRTYNEAMKRGPDTEIGLEHYKIIGGMENALANHAEAKYAELSGATNDLSTRQRIAKLVFQAITDMSTDEKGGRRPVSIETIYDIAIAIDAEPADVNKVINHFRDDDTSFIMPPASTPLHPNLIMDISHESIMRNWKRLRDWIEEEVNAGKQYKILNERRELFDLHKDKYITGGLLAEIRNWQAVFPGCAAWATRYTPKSAKLADKVSREKLYDRNMAFLTKSYAESQEETAKEKKELKNAMDRVTREKRGKVTITALSFVAITLLSFTVYSSLKSRTEAQRDQRSLAQKDSSFVQIFKLESRCDSIHDEQLEIDHQKKDDISKHGWRHAVLDSLDTRRESLDAESQEARAKLKSLKNDIIALNQGINTRNIDK